MNKKQFKSLRRRMNKLVRKAEEQALEEGIDITSKEFEAFRRKLKQKLLQKRGITLKEYEAIEEKLTTKKKVDLSKEITGLSKEVVDIAKEERKQQKQNHQQEIAEMKKALKTREKELREIIEKTKQEIPDSQKIKETVKPIIPKQKEYNWTDFPEFVRDLNDMDKRIDEMRSELGKGDKKKQKDLKGLEEDLDLLGQAVIKLYEERNKKET